MQLFIPVKAPHYLLMCSLASFKWSIKCNSMENEKVSYPFMKWTIQKPSQVKNPVWILPLCFMRKSLEFAPQQIDRYQSQLGALVGQVGGRGRKKQTDGKKGPALSRRHNQYTNSTHTHTQNIFSRVTIVAMEPATHPVHMNTSQPIASPPMSLLL